MENSKKAILLNMNDNVAVAVEEVKKGESVEIIHNNSVISLIKAVTDIEIYHKIAISPVEKGNKVYKYGEVIGKAVEFIEMGQQVHVNNIESVVVKYEN